MHILRVRNKSPLIISILSLSSLLFFPLNLMEFMVWNVPIALKP
jgi:hypothetical protein